MELINGHKSCLARSSRGALSILVASVKFARTSSYLVSRRLCGWNKEDSIACCFSSAVIGVCVGLMSVSVRMRRKMVSRSPLDNDVVSRIRKWDVSRNARG